MKDDAIIDHEREAAENLPSMLMVHLGHGSEVIRLNLLSCLLWSKPRKRLVRFDLLSFLSENGRQLRYTRFPLLSGLYKGTRGDSSQAESFHSIREMIDLKGNSLIAGKQLW